MEMLDQFAQTAAKSPANAVALLLWKNRFLNPELAVQITEQDIKEYMACTEYLQVDPRVKIFRPKGRPAQPAQAATKTRSAIPATEAEPDRPFVMVMITDKDGNAFKPIESTEEGAKIRDHHNQLRAFRDRAGETANRLMADLAAGNFSDATIREAAQMLKTFAQS